MNVKQAKRLLGLPSKYTIMDVKKSWKSKMKKYHPDLGYPEQKALNLNKAKCIVLDDLDNYQIEPVGCDCKKGDFCKPFDTLNEEEEFWNCVIDGTLDEYFS